MFSFYFSKLKNILVYFTYVYTPSNMFRAYIMLIVKLEHHLQNSATYNSTLPSPT